MLTAGDDANRNNHPEIQHGASTTHEPRPTNHEPRPTTHDPRTTTHVPRSSKITLLLNHKKNNPRNSEGAFITLADGRLMFAYSRYYGTSWSDNAAATISGRYSEDDGSQRPLGIPTVRDRVAQLAVNYFHYRNSSLAMSKVRNHAEDRLRIHLMKRHKVKDRGTGLGRFPSRDLYGRYGLYKVPAVAGWRSAHASA